ncbi:MAG: hypothetical protein ABIG96_00930 [Candidatus Micrarchaeota archaeon]
MTNGFGIRKAAILCIFAMAMLLPFAHALALVPESSSIKSCICETTLVKLTASNPSDISEAVTMGASGDKPWVIPGPKEFSLPAKSSKEITAFVTPDCFAIPGKYSSSVTAKSASGSATARIGIDVTSCVLVQEPAGISLCRGETASPKLAIRNIARDEGRSYALSVSSKDANPKAITILPKVFVDMNSEKTISYTIDASVLSVGEYNFDIKAQALYEATDVPTTDVDTATVKVEVKNCEAFELSAPFTIEVCAGVPTAFKISLVNKGAPADVKLASDASFLTLKPTSGTLHYGETAEIELNVNAPEGEKTVKLTATSDLKTVEKQISVKSRECFGTDLQMQAGKVICSEDGAEYDLVIKNRETPAEYKVSVSGVEAKLSSGNVNLGKFESQTLKFTIPKNSATGAFTAKITAESKDSKDTVQKEISIQKCYDFRLTGPAVELCPCETATINYELINFGVKDDKFSLASESDFVNLKEAAVSVASKEKAKLEATVGSCKLESGTYNGVIAAKSVSYPDMQDKLKIELTVKSKEQCYGIELKAALTSILSKCEIKSQAVTVTNRGSRETAVSLSATGGSKVTPDNLLLKSGESRNVNLVIFPSPSKCGTTFSVDMKAESKGVSASKQFAIDMEPEEKASPTPVQTTTPKPTDSTSEVKDLDAQINYENDSLIIKTLPGARILIAGEDGTPREEKADENGELSTKIGAGTFLITLSRAGYKPITLQVNVTGNMTGMGDGGSAANLGSIPLLLVAFLIVVAALYFVLKNDKGDGEEAEEEEPEEEEPVKPKRGRRKK